MKLKLRKDHAATTERSVQLFTNALKKIWPVLVQVGRSICHSV